MLRSKSFSPYKIIPYWLAQILGATIAGFINYQIFSTAIEHYETNNVIIRGELNSIRSAKTFGCYWSEDSVRDASQAFYIEAFGTSFLVLIVFCATHPLNKVIPTWGVPSVIGAAVAACVATLGGLTGAGINPGKKVRFFDFILVASQHFCFIRSSTSYIFVPTSSRFWTSINNLLLWMGIDQFPRCMGVFCRSVRYV